MAQISLTDRVSPWGREGYLLAKEIDGHPGREWSYAVFTSRVRAMRAFSPATYFYEPLASFDSARLGNAVVWDQFHANGDIDEMENITLGMRWYRSGFYATEGRLQPLQAGDDFVGHHVSVVVRTEGQNTLVFHNMWSDWGDDSFGYITRECFDDYVDEVWLGRPSQTGSSPAQKREMAAGSKYGSSSRRLAAIRRAWSTTRPIQTRTVLIEDRPHTLHQIRVLSARTHRTVCVMEITHEVMGSVARGHIQTGGDKCAEIEELFVWPNRRRRGYGAFLLNAMLAVAGREGHTEVTLPIYDADYLSINGPGAEAFLARHGFKLERVAEALPSCHRRAFREISP
jgi:GNAT superfamily N-acetyltransferase